METRSSNVCPIFCLVLDFKFKKESIVLCKNWTQMKLLFKGVKQLCRQKAIEHVEIKFTRSNASRKKIKLCTLLKHSFNNNRINPSLPSSPWVLLKWHIQQLVSQTQEEARHIFYSALLFSCNGLLIETREVSKRGLKLSRVLWFDYGWPDYSIWRSRRPLRPQFTTFGIRLSPWLCSTASLICSCWNSSQSWKQNSLVFHSWYKIYHVSHSISYCTQPYNQKWPSKWISHGIVIVLGND